MTFLLVLLTLAAVLAALTVVALRTDSRGGLRPPTSHRDDPAFRAPSTWR